MNEFRARAALLLQRGIATRDLALLWERFGSAAEILQTPLSVLQDALPSVESTKIAALLRLMESDEVSQELDQAAELEAEIVGLGDRDYPPLLVLTPNPPVLLWRRGPADEADARAVALVGARKATQYGRMVARSLGRGLAMAGVPVASGFAHGIDLEAMLGAAKAGGRAIGVLGCGLAVNYPATNAPHIETILHAGGAFYSAYPLNEKPHRGNFPARNHVLAGMSLGVCVVEARERSGSLITSDAAMELSRTVFAVPGDVTRETSRGANGLLQAGATLVMQAEDILASLSGEFTRSIQKSVHTLKNEREREPQSAVGHESPIPADKAKSSAPTASKGSQKKKQAASRAAPAKLDGLSPLERNLMDHLSTEPTALDDLLADPSFASAGFAGLMGALLNLELRGFVQSLPGKLYILSAGRH